MCPAAKWLYPEPERYLYHFGAFLDYYAGEPYADRSGAYSRAETGAFLWLADPISRNQLARKSAAPRVELSFRASERAVH